MLKNSFFSVFRGSFFGIFWLSILDGSSAALALQPASQSSRVGTEIARVGETAIFLEDFERRYKENSHLFPVSPPSKKLFLDEIVNRLLGVQEAKRLKIDKEAEFQDQVNTLLFQSFIDKKLGKEFENIRISDEEAKQYYSKNPEIRTSTIFVALKPDADPKEKQQALERIKRIQEQNLGHEKMSFAEVAQRFSDGLIAQNGGDLGFLSRDQIDPSYFDAAIKLSVGQVSGVVRTLLGYNIIKFTAQHSWEEANQARTKQLAFESEKAKIFDKFMKSLREKHHVSIHTDKL